MTKVKPQVAGVPDPLESEEQAMLFRWALWMENQFPELDLMYHTPNGGSRNKAEAARLKAQGVKSGVPDICLPVPRGQYHGLYIELKRQHGGRVSTEQARWIEDLTRQGYVASVCMGWEDAARVIESYLRLPKPKDITP